MSIQGVGKILAMRNCADRRGKIEKKSFTNFPKFAIIIELLIKISDMKTSDLLTSVSVSAGVRRMRVRCVIRMRKGARE